MGLGARRLRRNGNAPGPAHPRLGQPVRRASTRAPWESLPAGPIPGPSGRLSCAAGVTRCDGQRARDAPGLAGATSGPLLRQRPVGVRLTVPALPGHGPGGGPAGVEQDGRRRLGPDPRRRVRRVRVGPDDAAPPAASISGPRAFSRASAVAVGAAARRRQGRGRPRSVGARVIAPAGAQRGSRRPA